jgi:hypothetical protein
MYDSTMTLASVQNLLIATVHNCIQIFISDYCVESVIISCSSDFGTPVFTESWNVLNLLHKVCLFFIKEPSIPQFTPKIELATLYRVRHRK